MSTVQEKFAHTLDSLVAQVAQDRSILAAILCGSLSHDTVWAKSDIDLALVTIDDKKVEQSHVSLSSGGVNVHVFLMPRADFRKTVEGSLRNSFIHSMLAKGRMLYTHDPSLTPLFASLREMGERDARLQLLSAATASLIPVYKARKWFLTRGDLDYSALWILYAATALARMEVISARQLADREVIPQALKLNPAFFKIIYSDLLNSKKTSKSIQRALDAIDEYLATRAATAFAPLLEYLEEVGEARGAAEIEDDFRKNFNIECVTTACEYLADRGLIGKAAIHRLLTKKSNILVEELAFVHLGEMQDEF